MTQWMIDNSNTLIFTANFIVAALFWAMAKTFVKKEDFENFKTNDIEPLKKSISEIEATLEHLPDKDEFHQLDNNLVSVSGKLDAVKPQLDSLQRITDLLMENELRGKK